ALRDIARLGQARGLERGHRDAAVFAAQRVVPIEELGQPPFGLGEQRDELRVDLAGEQCTRSLVASAEVEVRERRAPTVLLGACSIMVAVEDDFGLGVAPLERRDVRHEREQRGGRAHGEAELEDPQPGRLLSRYGYGSRHASSTRSGRGTGTKDKTTRRRLLLQARSASRAPARRKARVAASAAVRAK